MKSIITTGFLFLLATAGYSQNIGINLPTASRAKLEVNGMVGNTTAIFGSDGNGVSLIASWPQLGFNAYYNAGTRAINNGYSAMQYMDPNSGTWAWDIFSNALKDQVPVSLKRCMTISNGRASFGDNAGFGATLNCSRPIGFDGSVTFGVSPDPVTTFNYGPGETTTLRGLPVRFNETAANSKLVIGNGAGLLGIGWNDPVYPLEIHGNTHQLAIIRTGSTLNKWVFGVSLHNNPYFTIGTAPAFNVTVSGKGYYHYSNGMYYAISDSRVKQEIHTLPSTLEKILLLQPVSYMMKYNDPDHRRFLGLIAQGVKELFPELVHTQEGQNAGYKDLDRVHLLNYSGLAPVVVKGLQEQEEIIQSLESRVEKLLQKLN